MRTPYVQLHVHLVWSTRGRQPLLTPELRERVYACILADCLEMKAEALAVGGIEDHVHVLVRYPASLSVSNLAKRLKGSSSHLVTHRLRYDENFKWQGAYGAFTLQKSLVPRLEDYIARQEEHHRNNTLYPFLEKDGEDE